MSNSLIQLPPKHEVDRQPKISGNMTWLTKFSKYKSTIIVNKGAIVVLYLFIMN